MAGRACKPDSVPRANQKRPAHAAIIPLVPASLPGSSSLPEGFQSTMDFATAKRSAFIFMNACSSSRAGSPLLFGLAPRGVFRAPDVATRAVGSYPTFSPLPNALDPIRRALGFAAGLPPRYKSHRRFIFCGTFRSRAAGCPCGLPAAQPPGVTRRVALPSPTLASSRRLESGLSSRPDCSEPAITRLTR